MYVFSYFPFGFEGRIWDLIVSVTDLCLSFTLYGIDQGAKMGEIGPISATYNNRPIGIYMGLFQSCELYTNEH